MRAAASSASARPRASSTSRRRHPRRRARVVAIPRASSASSSASPWGVDVNQACVTFPRGDADGVVRALRGASLRVPRGTLFMLLGPNGCGKSTLLRALAGLVKTDAGALEAPERKAFVFQNPDHQVIMPTVGADVGFGLGNDHTLSEEDVRERVVRALRTVNLTDDDAFERQVATLSGGQKQRVAIAGALVEEPELLLLDELTTFLDEADQRGVIEAVRRAVDESDGRVTALWVTHRLEELEFADGAAYMEDGVVVKLGTGKDIREFIREKQDQKRHVVASREN
jgi:energy-coupling factor transporter ATP-binding protein EcfA2|tara:strand:- start:6535 stop:7389 length:855 start_codon:yes stop_codon:yes gene_type:complete